jgi:hypothetical protein
MTRKSAKVTELEGTIEILGEEVHQLKGIIDRQKDEIDRVTENYNKQDFITQQLEENLENAKKRNRQLLDAIDVFRKVVPFTDVRNKVMADLLTLQPSLLAMHLHDDASTTIPARLLKEVPSGILPKIIEEFKSQRKIQAIIALRDRTGLGLKDAKETIDALWEYFRDNNY